MKVLLVEDDPNKSRELSRVLTELLPSSSLVISRSYQSGLKEILGGKFDLAIIDMTMPTFDRSPTEPGGRPRIYGGKEILQQMHRKNIAVPSIVVTQFESFGESNNKKSLSELKQELEKAFQGIYRGCVYYSASSSNWQSDFSELVLKVTKDSRV